jgi:hypothetical protein
MSAVRLAAIELPDFGTPTAEPVVPAAVYEARLATLRRRAAARGLDAILVYGDREHSANIAYLTGFDPRFEEALLIVTPGRAPALLLGNECFGYARIAKIELRRVLFQSFSLVAQPRDRSAPLDDILAGEGIGRGSRIGVVGWKYFVAGEAPVPEQAIEAPAYLVDALRQRVGERALVLNATDLLMHPTSGLRVINEVEQLAVFEFAACQTSSGVRNLLFNLRPGLAEHEAVQLLRWNGTPLSCHLMLSSGLRAGLGLASPSDKRIERGDPFTVAFGIWGALNCRAGFVVAGAEELPVGIRDYVDRLVTPYFRAVAAWYETIGIGVPGGQLFEVIDRHIGDPFFGVGLNPGHQLHLDEWVNSPIQRGSDQALASGMAFQVDVIPATGTDYFTSNIEDGIALADAPLRAEFAARFPEAWARIEARRAFMRDRLGIRLKPEVLPFSNIPAYLPPFLLRPGWAMTMAAAA